MSSIHSSDMLRSSSRLGRWWIFLRKVRAVVLLSVCMFAEKRINVWLMKINEFKYSQMLIFSVVKTRRTLSFIVWYR